MEKQYFFFLFFGGFVIWIFIFFFLRYTNKNAAGYFKKLAEKYNISIDVNKKIGMAKFPSAEGMYRGYPLFIDCLKTNEGGKKYIHTSIRLLCKNPDNLTFLIVRRSRANAAKYDSNEIKINDSEFDEKFILNTNAPDRMMTILDFNIKYKLLQSASLGMHGEIKLEGETVSFTEPELIKNDTVLLRTEVMIHVLTDVGDSLKFK
jgi:hypothetical protein